jgi:hypothetical protein
MSKSKPGPRSLHPGAALSESLAACEPLAQLLFDRLLCQADDQGRVRGSARQVAALCMPLIEEASPERIGLWLSDLERERMILRYVVEGRELVQIVNWWTFQSGMKRGRRSEWSPPAGWADLIFGDQESGIPPTFNAARAANPDGGTASLERRQAPLRDLARPSAGRLESIHDASVPEPGLDAEVLDLVKQAVESFTGEDLSPFVQRRLPVASREQWQAALERAAATPGLKREQIPFIDRAGLIIGGLARQADAADHPRDEPQMTRADVTLVGARPPGYDPVPSRCRVGAESES